MNELAPESIVKLPRPGFRDGSLMGLRSSAFIVAQRRVLVLAASPSVAGLSSCCGFVNLPPKGENRIVSKRHRTVAEESRWPCGL